MNQQNNFNSQMNPDVSNNTNSNPMKPVKNRFFNRELFADTNMEDVGSSTSNQVSNQVISWGVGRRPSSFNGAPTTENTSNNNNALFTQELLGEVNGVVYTADEPEVLDDFDLIENNTSSSVESENLFGFMTDDSSEVKNSVNSQVASVDNNVNIVQQQIVSNENNNINIPPSRFQNQTVNATNAQASVSDYNQGSPLMQMNNSSDYNQQVYQSNNQINQNTQVFNQPAPSIVNDQGAMNQQPMLSNQGNYGQVDHQIKPFVAPSFNQNGGIPNNSPVNMINDDLLGQQPLSASSLGASALEMENEPDDVAVDSKYFPNPANIGNKVEPIVPAPAPLAVKTQVSLVDDDVIVIDEKAMLKAYVGSNYEKYNMTNFSLTAMLGGSFVYFYRKLYILGIIIFAIQILAFLMLKDSFFILLAVWLVIALVLAFVTNPLYLWLAKQSVNEIKKKHPKISQGEINSLCARKGKSNILIALLLQCVLLFVAIFLSLQIVGEDYFTDLYNDALDLLAKKEVTVYDGKLYYNHIDITDYFDITTPREFVSDAKEIYKYIYVTNSEGVNNNCSVTFGQVSGYGTPLELLKQIEKYNELENAVSSNEIDGLVWYSLTTETDEGKKYYRAVNLNGSVYVLEFLNGKDTTQGVCDAHFVNIFDSIKEK